jgi:hypothetical protein
MLHLREAKTKHRPELARERKREGARLLPFDVYFIFSFYSDMNIHGKRLLIIISEGILSAHIKHRAPGRRQASEKAE